MTTRNVCAPSVRRLLPSFKSDLPPSDSRYRSERERECASRPLGTPSLSDGGAGWLPMRCWQVRGRVQLGTRYIRLARICGCREHFTVGEFFSLNFSFKWETRKRAGTPTAAYCFPLLERPIPHSLSLCLCVCVCLFLSLFCSLRSVLFFFSQGFANSSDPLQVRFFTCFFSET